MIKTFEFPKYYSIQINEETGEVKIFSNSKHAKGRELSQFLNPSGYLRVKMNNRSYQIHRIVTKFYLGDMPKGLCVNHKDGNKLNNRPSNLEYITFAENIKHSIATGLHVCNRPHKIGTYIDGRTRDKVKYKHDWYVKNRERILLKTKLLYNARKQNKKETAIL
jgi:hypothetical protein